MYAYEDHYQNSILNSHLGQKLGYEYCCVHVLLIICIITIFGIHTLPTPLMNITGNLFDHHELIILDMGRRNINTPEDMSIELGAGRVPIWICLFCLPLKS